MALEMMRVPIAEPLLGQKEIEYVGAAIRSGWVSGRGPYVEQFESKFSEWLGVQHAVATSSGTSALHLALASLGIEEGDEVIIPAFSMAAIAFAVTYTRAKPVLADAEVSSWNVDPGEIKKKITTKTKGIVVMHTYGHPADIDPIIETAHRHGIYVVEDAAEALGAEYKGKKAGTLADVGCFSFFANKLITTGEGGMLVTKDEGVASRAKLLRDMAFTKEPSQKFVHSRVGYNYRVTNVQAAIGLAQLERIEDFITIRRRNAQTYRALLSDTRGLTLPPELGWARNVFWMYSVLVDEDEYGLSRDDLMRTLGNYDIETRPFFTPIHRQPAYSELNRGVAYPVSERLSATGLNLPSGNTLTEGQVEYVTERIRSLSKPRQHT